MRSRTEAMRCEYSRDSEAIKLIRAAYERGLTFLGLGKKAQQLPSNSIGCKRDIVKTLLEGQRSYLCSGQSNNHCGRYSADASCSEELFS